MSSDDIAAVTPGRVLLLTLAFAGAVTEDHLNEMHELVGWSVDFLRFKASELGIHIEPGEGQVA